MCWAQASLILTVSNYLMPLARGVTLDFSADMWKFHRGITRPFFTHDRISHFNIFDRHAEDAITLIKSRLRAGYPVDFQVYPYASISLPRNEFKIFRMLFHVSPLMLQPSFSSGNVHTVSPQVLSIPITWLQSGTRLINLRLSTTFPMHSQTLNTRLLNEFAELGCGLCSNFGATGL